MASEIDPYKAFAEYVALRQRIDGSSQFEMSQEIGISAQYFSDMLHKRREINAAALAWMGYERIETIRRIKPEKDCAA